jgi:hypothetical protein
MLTRACLALLILLSMAQSGDTRVRFRWPHRIVTDRDSTTWIVLVDRYPEHRLLTLAAVQDGDVVRRSDVQLEGEHAARVHRIEWRGGLPAGDIQIAAIVYSQTEEVGRAVVPVQVIAMLP